MKRILFVAAALVIAGAATPAVAQVYVGADTGGVGVNVGPFGVGVGPDYWSPPYRHRYWRDYAYAAPECRSVRTRIVTPHGHLIWRTRQICG
jgi:hypothetical protein